jgi:putative inorganic carbon (HCO3(-)) transporter
LLAGVLVAVVGILQVPGLNLAPLLARQTCFSADVVSVEGVRRATSVYCHPNNLGLALGRVWPVLAALALLGAAAPSSLQRVSQGAGRRLGRTYNALAAWSMNRLGLALLPALLAAVVLAGIAASFSRGAIIGGVVALIVLGIVLRRRLLVALATGIVILGLVAMFATGIERFNPLGGSSSARLELWGSAVAMLRDHPLSGVGLDQFYHLRNATPGGGRYISPDAAASSELYASHPHNAVLDVLLRTGPFGLAVMLLLIVHFYRTAFRLLRTTELPRGALVAGLLASMCGALVHGLLDNFYFVADLAMVFWTQVALVELLMYEQRETESPPAEVRP